jgi:hypothetical protein
MAAQGILQAWREILPANVSVSGDTLLNNTIQLTERERESMSNVETQRMRELESGRVYAKGALATIGITDIDLPIAQDRSPLWPAGVVGSLTHLTDRSKDWLLPRSPEKMMCVPSESTWSARVVFIRESGGTLRIGRSGASSPCPITSLWRRRKSLGVRRRRWLRRPSCIHPDLARLDSARAGNDTCSSGSLSS